MLIVGLKGGVAGSFHVFFEDEVDGAAGSTNLDILLVGEAEFPRYIWVNGLNIHVCGCGEGELFPPVTILRSCALVRGSANGITSGDYCNCRGLRSSG